MWWRWGRCYNITTNIVSQSQSWNNKQTVLLLGLFFGVHHPTIQPHPPLFQALLGQIIDCWIPFLDINTRYLLSFIICKTSARNNCSIRTFCSESLCKSSQDLLCIYKIQLVILSLIFSDPITGKEHTCACPASSYTPSQWFHKIKSQLNSLGSRPSLSCWWWWSWWWLYPS